ncbi:hypothetical protein GCM10027589_35780 [Actinocorallia lasiicapitis]
MDIQKILGYANDPKVQQMMKSVVANGSVQDLLSKLGGSGLQNQVNSWIGKGENEPITAQQVESALGEEQLGKVAQEAGMSPRQAASDLAQTLPDVVDKATPDGKADDLGKVLSGLFK